MQTRAVSDPLPRELRVEVADDLRLTSRVPGMGDPDVPAPESVVGDASGDVADNLPVPRRDGAARSLERPFDLSARFDEVRQQRLDAPMPGVPLGQERRGRLDVLRGNGSQLEAATTRRRPRRLPGP